MYWFIRAWCAFRGHRFGEWMVPYDGPMIRVCARCGVLDQW